MFWARHYWSALSPRSTSSCCAARRIPARLRAAMPVAAIGLALQVLSGIVLLAADAMPVMGNAAFQFKMAMFALGLVNVAAFYWRYGGALKADAPLDRGVGFAAVSLASWVLVLLAGRATAYI
jgi:hypothetical protein